MPNNPILEYRNFSFSYANSPFVLGPVNWTVNAGEFVVLTGNTGCGKTTLLTCAKPELRPTGSAEGDIFLAGVNSLELDISQSVRTCGYVAQSPENQLICDNVWHQMAFGLENLGTTQSQMRRQVAEVAHYFGMEPWFHMETEKLSGGQKQLLNLASVLVMQPRLLFLDEPTAQLDPVAEKNFLHALFRLNRELGITIVLATHAPESVLPYATRRAHLENGALSERPMDAAAENKQATKAVHQTDITKASSSNSAIVLKDVSFRYARELPVVFHGMDLEIHSGEIYALVGGNGCGKSTLLRLIAGVNMPQRGRITNKLQSRQALLPQDPKALFMCDTVLEELQEWQKNCEYSDAEIEEALVQIGLESHKHQHPYDLSGGQQQLLALQKLLLTKPDLLMLDEPTKGLDAQAKLQVARVLKRVATEGTTVVIATHDLEFAQSVAMRVNMIFDGQSACVEPANEFFCGNIFYVPTCSEFSFLMSDEAKD